MSTSTKKSKKQPVELVEITDSGLEMNVIYNEDCIQGMKKINSESVDIVICDPPYNIGKDFGNDSDYYENNAYDYDSYFLVHPARGASPTPRDVALPRASLCSHRRRDDVRTTS
jgi:adenine-specific DNA methylase